MILSLTPSNFVDNSPRMYRLKYDWSASIEQAFGNPKALDNISLTCNPRKLLPSLGQMVVENYAD